MSGQENIDPLQDIDFESMGIMTKPDDNDPPASSNNPDPNDDPNNPDPKPNPKDPLNTEDPNEDPDEDPNEDPDEDPNEDPDEDPDPNDDPDEDPDPDEDDPDEDPDPDPNDEQPTVVSEITELIGFEDLDPAEYDDSVEGIGRLVQDASAKLAEQQKTAELEQYPELKEFYDYVSQGGDPDEFHRVRGQAIDYEQIEVEEDNEVQQEQIVRQQLELNEHEQEEIDGIIEKYKAGGILKDQAEVALKSLQRYSAKQKQQMIEEQKEIAKANKEKVDKFWGEVEQTLKTKNEFKGITIPKKEVDQFFDYISKPVNKDGYSQRDLDALELGLEEKLAIDYLIYKGFPLGDIVDKKAKTKQATDLRKRIKSGGDPKPRKANHPKPAGDGEPKVADLDLI